MSTSTERAVTACLCAILAGLVVLTVLLVEVVRAAG